ncbi:alcohol-forming fatty acyl-CoA reductase-like isoform X1 [Rhododendron vialii]|uniref:alcohol-forming fatty acyl-CoA reductase-like isoform X1 n=1 Tax=Rhododendron vialii TaxID=182163 RepID=UPI00265DC2B3|nr:alcohol-forming fatty acyl-CoA reductase-like isoform X1 [Rhododendron vialii]
MELGNVAQFLENRSILVTGATGFLAKIFVEKILRVQPNVKKLYLLVRAPDAKSASQRFHDEAIAKDLFRVLREKMGAASFQTLISEKVTLVPGDITCEKYMGVKDSNLAEEMRREVDIVVNLAATTNFDERYDVAFNLNTMGAKNVLDFSKMCAKLKMLLHVSTAYVSGERAGLILEKPYCMGETLNGLNLDLDMEKKIMEERLIELQAKEATEQEITLVMKDLGIQRARKYGWPNTYVFTKAMGEMLLGQIKGNTNSTPLVILRPTIITSTYKEPFPGWVEGIRTVDSFVVSYGKGRLTCLLGDSQSILDMIPADMVVNSMLVAMAANATHDQLASDDHVVIYQVGSSVSNPIRLNSVQDYVQLYFQKHPWIGRDGKAVKVGNVTRLTSMASFHRYMAIWYLLPLKGLQLANTTFCHFFEGTYSHLSRKIMFLMRLVELYKPYLFFKGM